MAGDLDSAAPMPEDHVPDDIPAVIAQEGEVVVAVQPEGLLVAGDPTEIEAYVDRIRGAAGHAIGVMGVDKAALGNATGLAAGEHRFSARQRSSSNCIPRVSRRYRRVS
ncbi:type 1 glutamine amidotransferase family protein [Mycolicibacterium conceptionense]|uniref:hypothetical protein n=1 Tax=Mycolicibacterium conceptionense TaxID=451644 RepID=UPI001F2B5E78|nr:hypothetical protein [Mycolicibacterium conceptionense]